MRNRLLTISRHIWKIWLILPYYVILPASNFHFKCKFDTPWMIKRICYYQISVIFKLAFGLTTDLLDGQKSGKKKKKNTNKYHWLYIWQIALHLIAIVMVMGRWFPAFLLTWLLMIMIHHLTGLTHSFRSAICLFQNLLLPVLPLEKECFTEKKNLYAYANCTGSGHTAHLHSMVRACYVRPDLLIFYILHYGRAVWTCAVYTIPIDWFSCDVAKIQWYMQRKRTEI